MVTNVFYNLSNIVFLGGSIINRGGQNPLEPARLGVKFYMDHTYTTLKKFILF